MKKISEERARRKYLKDVKAQATLNKIKKQNQETAKEKNSVNKSKYNAREASAKLASMIPNPKYYERHQDSSGLIERSGIILSRMSGASVP